VNVLAVVHGPLVRAGIFADAIEARGHRFLEWKAPAGGPPPDADAVIVFGGSMHVDQEEQYPWLLDEDTYIRRLLAAGTPMLGICLGAQLLAKAAGAHVGPSAESEIGWFPVELTEAADDDPVLGRLPRRFDAFQWHHYAFAVPPNAVELVRNDVCTQAFRLDDTAWGVQFHPEVTLAQVRGWADEKHEVPGHWDEFLASTAVRMPDWNRLGRTLCDAFLEAAARVRV
jgi:GMP synthase-like glutamine amidotransferase